MSTLPETALASLLIWVTVVTTIVGLWDLHRWLGAAWYAGRGALIEGVSLLVMAAVASFGAGWLL